MCSAGQSRPLVLSTDEVARFLAGVPNLKHRMALTTAYAAGLRVSEVVRLKIADIDSARMLLRVEQGKGGKDRYVMLSPRLLAMLRRYWRAEKPCHWLFPGHNQSRSLNPSVLQGACRAARAVPASINPITRTPRSRVRSFGRAAGTNEFAAATFFHHEIVYGVRIFPAARSPCRLGSRTGRMGTD